MIDLILGDCLIQMRDIPDHSIDAVICDLPYGTIRQNHKWDVPIPFAPMWEQLTRVTKSNGAIVLFGTQPFTAALIMSNAEMFKYEWVWNKRKAGNFTQAYRRPLQIHENIVVFYREQCTYNPQKTLAEKPNTRHLGKKSINRPDNALGGSGGAIKYSRQYEPDKLLPTSLLEFKKDAMRLHPTQKPVALIEYLVRTYTQEGETVLDFAAGVFTTAIACLNTGRNCICIEKEPKYYAIGKERVERHAW